MDDNKIEKLMAACNKTIIDASRLIIKNTLDAGGDHANIMIALDSVVTVVLLATYKDTRMAAIMLEESLVTGVINRLSLAKSRLDVMNKDNSNGPK